MHPARKGASAGLASRKVSTYFCFFLEAFPTDILVLLISWRQLPVLSLVGQVYLFELVSETAELDGRADFEHGLHGDEE